jgi:Protein of unknown function (DUF3313)
LLRSRLNATWSLAAVLLTGGCASVPFEQTGALSSYKSLEQSDGMLTHAQVSVSKNEVLAAQTVRIVPTSFSNAAAQAGLSQPQRHMIANVVDRWMCIGLSDRFRVAPPEQPADLRVHAVITHVGLTDEKIAGVSRAASIGVSIAEKILVPYPVPVPTPRIPVGLAHV